MVSVIIPVYNESTSIDELVVRLKSSLEAHYQYEIWFVDDGSSDNSLSKIRESHLLDNRIKCISFSRNFGHHNAIAAGIDHVQGSIIVLMDGDLQDRPECIPNLLEVLESGFDIVCARRNIGRGTWFKRQCSRLFWRFIRFSSGLELTSDQSIMRAFNKPVLDSLRKIKESNRFYSALFSWVGFKQTAIEVQYDERKFGKTKYSFRKQIKLAMDAIFGFSQLPLWSLIIGGLTLLAIGFASNISPITSFNPLVFSGVIVLGLGITAYQIRQFLRDSKKRPLYIVQEIIE